MMKSRPGGFTLIELLITVGVVAVLTAIALPSYRQYVIRANRSAEQQFMRDVSNREEQFILDQRSYTTTLGAGGLGMTPPSEVTGNYASPVITISGNDCLGTALSGPGYVIRAAAIGAQASDGDLCVDSRNNKTPAAKW